MAKFCTKCGKPLEEGQVCDCQSTVSQNQTVGGTNVDLNSGINDFINIAKGIFTKPVDTVKEYSKSNKGLLGIIAILINCVVSGFFFYFLCDKALGGMASLFGGGYGSLMSGSYNLPFGRLFFMGFLMLLFWFAVCGLVLYAIANPILKDKVDIKAIFALVGVCSVFTTITTLVAWIFVFVKVWIALVVLLIAAGFYLTHLYQGLSDITKIEKNKLVYTFMPAVAVATFVMVYIVPKFFS